MQWVSNVLRFDLRILLLDLGLVWQHNSLLRYWVPDWLRHLRQILLEHYGWHSWYHNQLLARVRVGIYIHSLRSSEPLIAAIRLRLCKLLNTYLRPRRTIHSICCSDSGITQPDDRVDDSRG